MPTNLLSDDGCFRARRFRTTRGLREQAGRAWRHLAASGSRTRCVHRAVRRAREQLGSPASSVRRRARRSEEIVLDPVVREEAPSVRDRLNDDRPGTRRASGRAAARAALAVLARERPDVLSHVGLALGEREREAEQVRLVIRNPAREDRGQRAARAAVAGQGRADPARNAPGRSVERARSRRREESRSRRGALPRGLADRPGREPAVDRDMRPLRGWSARRASSRARRAATVPPAARSRARRGCRRPAAARGAGTSIPDCAVVGSGAGSATGPSAPRGKPRVPGDHPEVGERRSAPRPTRWPAAPERAGFRWGLGIPDDLPRPPVTRSGGASVASHVVTSSAAAASAARKRSWNEASVALASARHRATSRSARSHGRARDEQPGSGDRTMRALPWRPEPRDGARAAMARPRRRPGASLRPGGSRRTPPRGRRRVRRCCARTTTARDGRRPA